jgi:metal-dependent amidase/aminoacylase/carboxypeptidase family protein
MNSFEVHFHGIAAHGGGVPHLGRSALDGALLMDVGVNYLREPMEQVARIHSVISDGGRAPNVVPPEATIWARSPSTTRRWPSPARCRARSTRTPSSSTAATSP